MPINSPTGGRSARWLASVCGFAVIWHIWWLAILGLIGAFAVLVWYAWQDEHGPIFLSMRFKADARERRPHSHGAPPPAEPVDMTTEAATIGLLTEARRTPASAIAEAGVEERIVVPYGY